ncbi:hypothetical protein BSKO_00462 [Bryopsis sp. KO-2023]|nr:hypothetical protein BSKO_00462 [Bryopsis sp. KO-2023]
MPIEQVVLVTGCSSEIGHTLCHTLHHARSEWGSPAYRVFASDYNVDGMADLEHAGFETLHMDVTREDSVLCAVRAILKKAGRVDAVICDAGIVSAGPIVDHNIDNAARVLDINVLGFMRVVQAVTPIMMKQKHGLIVATGCVSSYLTTPFGGVYSGSKACLHSITEALRMELQPWSVGVMLVEVGMFGCTMAQNAVHQLPPFEKPRPAYKQAFSGETREHLFYLRNNTAPGELRAGAEKVVKAMQKRRPPRKVQVGGQSKKLKFLGFLQVWLSPRMVSRRLTKACGLDAVITKMKKRSISTQT